MKYILFSFFIVLCIGFLLIFFYSLKSKKPVKMLLLNSLLGIATIIILNLTNKYTGIYIPINLFSVSGASVYGIPAVCGILIFKLIFI